MVEMLAAPVAALVLGFLGVCPALAQSLPAVGDPSFRLIATVNAPGVNQELKVWAWHDLTRFKKSIAREKDPKSGKVVKSEGFLLASLVDQTLESLPLENRAQIDLIVLKNALGQQALVPRALMIKYPLLLAMHSGSSARDSLGPVSVVVPWTSKPKIQNEELPLESFFVSNLTQIELTNYRHQFGPLFLKRRTDPSAMRGEKLFVQSCAGCHEAGQSQRPPSVVQVGQTKRFVEKGHPGAGVLFRMNDRDRGAILRYAEALQSERMEKVTQIEQPFQKTKDL